MDNPVLPQPLPEAYGEFIRAEAARLRAKDQPPRSLQEWETRRIALREKMFAAMGAFPSEKTPLQPQIRDTLRKDGYQIQKLTFQSRPHVWVTATAYVPDTPAEKKLPAVLVVHGHWAWARRDPVVQSRCVGLAKLGFFVLAVDAFGAGERFIKPGRGTYHGALHGSTLWPVGQSLLGLQVYDNMRAADYLQSRPEVDPNLLGVTGASGGGNQSMYIGALDERFKAVVPVCSVGTYQAYLKAACCVCEVLPGALRFTEEGDVLGLIAPRALMVINATKDAFQFSVGEAKKSVARAEQIFALYRANDRLKHVVIDSGHDYNQAMREAMYGFMTRWLKGIGTGEPIPEPKFDVEPPEALEVLPPNNRPETFRFPATLAKDIGKELVQKVQRLAPTHAPMWEATAADLRRQLVEQLGSLPNLTRGRANLGSPSKTGDMFSWPLRIESEAGFPIPCRVLAKDSTLAKLPACLVLHLDGKDRAAKHRITQELLDAGWQVVVPDLRATGETRPNSNAIAGAPDHNAAEHGIWIGRPLLGQWLTDVQAVLDWMSPTPQKILPLVGIGWASVVALGASALFSDRISAVATIEGPITLLTDSPYAAGTSMGVLAPGLLHVGDIPHIAALTAPRRLFVIDGISPVGGKVRNIDLEETFAFTRRVYSVMQAKDRFQAWIDYPLRNLVKALGTN